MGRTLRSRAPRSSAIDLRKADSPPPVSSLLTPHDDQSDEDGDDPLTLAPSRRTSRSSKGTFKGVFIPPMEPSASSFKRPLMKRRRHSPTPSSSVSPASFTRANSSDYDTPATSLAVTPVESVASSKFGFAKYAGVAASGTKKRKLQSFSGVGENDSEVNDTSGDAQLAALMQEEEYAVQAPQQAKKKSDLPRSRLVHPPSDSEDSSSDLSVLSDSSEDIPLSKKRKVSRIPHSSRKIPQPIRKGKAPASSLPKRAARTNAQKAIAKTSLVIDDSDDSPLSDFIASDFEAASDLEHFGGESVEEDSDADSSTTPSLAAGGSVPWSSTSLRTHRQNWLAREERKRLNRAAREREKLEHAHPEIKTMWADLKAVPKIEAEQAPQPAGITRSLKSFQLEGLNWMIMQEQTKWKGGLLGDEMGMGKTIQAVSLIMSDHPAKDPTLVIVPPVALIQWANEIKDYTNGKLNVLIYHGTNNKAKGLSVEQLRAFDVIMISYPGLESIYRKEVKGWTRKSPDGDKIVKEDSAIHAIHFHRLILDEAHSIKSRTAGVAKACFALKGTYKWCLSGTPVQNRIGEFFSLLRFLECQPFANYFCKSCSCSALHWSVSEDYRCTHCRHRALDHVSVFNQEILNPITSNETATKRKDALVKLRLLTDRVMLRRMKRDYTSSMELPPKDVVIHNEFFGEIERDFSSSIMSNTTRTFDTYVSRGVMLNNYANIFGLIMQMRQVSDHPDLLLKKHAAEGQNVMVCNICDEPAEDAIRSKCRHEFCRSCVKDYVRSVEGAGGSPDCPRCHIPLAIDFDQPEIEQDEEAVKKTSIINRIKMENWTSSTKIEMLVYDLYKLRSKKQTLKSIVFSQFTSMLQLIEWRLRRAGFNTVMLDGTMTPAQRQKSIEYFMNNTDVEVFLVSLKAGGVALNLTEASRVFIVDPWWNPAAEWQSADRCHRIGQRRPCVITRLCIEDSVESRIVMLQEKKAAMISGCVNGDDVAMEKLTPEDMQFLFRGS